MKIKIELHKKKHVRKKCHILVDLVESRLQVLPLSYPATCHFRLFDSCVHVRRSCRSIETVVQLGMTSQVPSRIIGKIR